MSEMEVQRAEGTEGRQLGGRARVCEAPSCCAGRQVDTAVRLGHAAVWGGGDVEIRSVGRHGEYVSATCTQTRRAWATHRNASAMGGVHEALAIWPGQRQLMVTSFAEKRLEMSARACRVPSGGEFLCADCGDDFLTLQRLTCHRGKAHGVRRPAARFVRDGVCPHCRVNFHCRARAMAHLEKGARGCREALIEGQLVELTEEELKEADLEMVQYRRQARVEGAHPDVRLLAVSM